MIKGILRNTSGHRPRLQCHPVSDAMWPKHARCAGFCPDGKRTPWHFECCKSTQEAAMNSCNTRLYAMVAGWAISWYGVRRRDWPGTLVAMSGLGLVIAAMTAGGSEHDA